MGWNMEGYIIKSVNHMNGFTIKNYKPNMDELEIQKTKTRIIKQLQFIFSNDTKSFDT
jgi:hypothetical protein